MRTLMLFMLVCIICWKISRMTWDLRLETTWFPCDVIVMWNLCWVSDLAENGVIRLHAFLLGITGLILGLRPANDRRRYKVTPSLIGWAQTYCQPWYQPEYRKARSGSTTKAIGYWRIYTLPTLGNISMECALIKVFGVARRVWKRRSSALAFRLLFCFQILDNNLR